MGGSSRQAKDITERTFQFALRIVRLVRAIPRDTAGYVIARQLVRSGTSIGANVEEAQAAQSRRDFTRKMKIAHGEARECRYWLRLVKEAAFVPAEKMGELEQESDELVRVLSTIIVKTRENDQMLDNDIH